MRLYYLTGAQYGLNNLALRRVKIARIAELNDPFELLAVDLQDSQHRRMFQEWKEDLNHNNGLICFSRSWENPVLWGHYAEKHTGMALGFEVPDHIPAEVIYSMVPETILIDNNTNKPDLSEALINRLLRTKFYDWNYENEMRIFVDLDHKTRESGLYFYDFSSDFQLREVILGPRCELPLESIRVLVSGLEPAVIVTKSKIAFDFFKIIAR